MTPTERQRIEATRERLREMGRAVMLSASYCPHCLRRNVPLIDGLCKPCTIEWEEEQCQKS